MVSNTIFTEVVVFFDLIQKNRSSRAKSQRKTRPNRKSPLALPQLIRKIVFLTFIFFRIIQKINQIFPNNSHFLALP